MPKSYRQLLIDLEVHEQLHAARARISELFFHIEGQLGLSSVIALLLEHYANTPPELEWLRKRVLLMPMRGRPRTSNPNFVPVPHGLPPKKDQLGHEWASPAAKPKLRVCKRCHGLDWPEEFHLAGSHPCRGTPVAPQTKELLMKNLFFTAEEVAWADG